MARPRKSSQGLAQKFTVSLSPEAAQKLEEYRAKNERDRSWVVEKLILRHLSKLP
jgi:predicted transcriptional regulator